MASHYRIRLQRPLTALTVTVLLGLSICPAKVASGARGLTDSSAKHNSPGEAANSPAFSAAAAENERLSKTVNWSFGGKIQHGWYIYVPLIKQEIGSDSPVGSAEFAHAVARWQRGNSIPATGILDEPTWVTMVGDFQNARMKNRPYAGPDALVTVPVENFYDQSRPEELREVERSAYAAYQRMVAAATADKSLGLVTGGPGRLSADEKFLKIISAFRSREYQEHLRAQSPNSGRAGLAINSPHFTGRALDLYVGGEPVSTRDDNRALQTGTPVYSWLVRNAARFGFKPYFYEPWHWEYVR